MMAKKTMMVFVAALLSLGASAAVQLVSPQAGSTVPLLSERQKAFMKMSREERAVFFDDAQKDKEKEVTTLTSEPQPVRLEWTGEKGPYVVTVTKRGEKKPFFTKSVRKSQVDVWNLEIAADYEWRVEEGTESATGSFRTEDQAPRLLHWQGTRNVRDLGGRVMPDGRRVRQGLVFRSAGLNDNAKTIFYTVEEIEQLEKEGKLAGMGPVGKEYSAKLKAGRKLEKAYVRLIKQMPTAPGKKRFSPETVRYILDTFGIRTDIDLRSERERFGMTESPLGPTVAFVHDWENYHGYSSVHKAGKEATIKIFRMFMDRKNYPIDFHCIGGADRTGTVATLLHGVLGASDEDIWKDYQITAWTGGVNDARHLGWFKEFVKSFNRYPGKTLSQRIVAYFHEIGFTDADLNQIRDILLEP